jgi:2-polyprenyl-3-methyl-5-hydroxy-6-metoxy-1,4-benzoquinol methylase
MDKFLAYDDELGVLINSASVELFTRLLKVDVDKIGMPEHCLHYFKTSHSKRLFFSTETSAHILYKAIRLKGKMPKDIVLMDYGAGVGTLFLLAKMIGCSQVIYNDHLEDWRKSAELIANAIDVRIDHFIIGDINDCLDRLQTLNIRCDIITSRNVVEHIYKLEEFYSSIHQKQPTAIVFSSTTANKSNPAVVVKHRMWHRKWEKVYRGKRLVAIERQSPGMVPFRKKKLAYATRGLAVEDLKEAIEAYRKTGVLPDPAVFSSNTCDPSNGVWAENLLDMKTYRRLINENHFTVSFAPGFWDTHYRQSYMNVAAKLLNKIIAKSNSIAMSLAPFIYVIASPKKQG